MKYSIIIPSYNNKDLTIKCLQSIRNNTVEGDYEVIVVDNASTDAAPELLKKEKDILLIENEVNRNFSGACNQGAKESNGDFLVFLNNDTEVHRGWLEEVGKIFTKDSSIGIVGAKLLFPDGKVQHAGVVISPDKVPRPIYYHDSASAGYVNKERDFQAVTAACLAVRRTIFEEVGGFDESYKNGLEDIDFCLKVGKLGYTIVYTPKVIVTHHESVAPGRFKYNVENMKIYMNRWKALAPDEHAYYRADGKSWLWILGQDLRSMSYGPNEYGTRPLYVSILRIFYIPLHKFLVILGYIFRGDFLGLTDKVKGKINAKS